MSEHCAHLENLTTSTWPALASEYLDGWVLRFARGYTKRANSITPLTAGTLRDHDKIAYCEQRYAEQGLPATFKLTAATQQLDAILVERGYTQVDISAVQQRSLLGFTAASVDADVALSAAATDAWFAAFTALNGVERAHQATARQMVESYVCPTQFALLVQEGQVKACAFAVIQFNTLVLYDVVSHADQRRQGYALRVVSQLLAWGCRQGATSAVLQVVVANAPAVALYRKLGFTEQYRYWYRRQPALTVTQRDTP